jgi:hypothetical protein
MATLPKAFYMFNAISINIAMTYITEIENSMLKGERNKNRNYTVVIANILLDCY